MPSHQLQIEHPFARYIRTLGKGKTGSRSLSQEEAYTAMHMILENKVEDVQLGAFLMLLRVKEETADELAGFVRAVRDWLGVVPIAADLDWSSYAGKRQQLPWFLLSALCLSSQGYRIFMHGTCGHTAGRLYTEDVLRALQLPVSTDWTEVQRSLDSSGFAYMPLQNLCAPLQRLINFRAQLGLRSPVHTLCRLLNPLGANNSMQSVFHPAYAAVHQQAAQLLGQHNAVVIKGDGGECELRPQADSEIYWLRMQSPEHGRWQRTYEEKPAASSMDSARLIDVWRGGVCDNYAEQAILGTLALAYSVINQTADHAGCLKIAQRNWDSRDRLLL